MKNNIELVFLTEQTVDGDTQKTKQKTVGTLEKQPGGEILIEYREPDSEMKNCTSELFIESSKKVHLIRTGLYNTHFAIEEGQTYRSLYRSPFIETEMTIKTAKADVSMKNDKGTVFLVYSIFSGNELLSNNKLLITIKTKD